MVTNSSILQLYVEITILLLHHIKFQIANKTLQPLDEKKKVK